MYIKNAHTIARTEPITNDRFTLAFPKASAAVAEPSKKTACSHHH